LTVDNEFCKIASNSIRIKVCQGSHNSSVNLRKYLIIGAIILLQIVCIIMFCYKRGHKEMMKNKLFSYLYYIIIAVIIIVDICVILFLIYILLLIHAFSHTD